MSHSSFSLVLLTVLGLIGCGSGFPSAQTAGAAGSAVIIDPSNSAILYSPYNWSVTSGYARTINSGAYFRTVFSGTSAVLLTDTSPDAAPYSQFWARVDNQGWTQYGLSTGNPKIQIARNLQDRKHLLEIIVKSTSETLARWTNSQTVLQITGLQLDPGASVSAPLRRSKNVLIFGDSITEGVRTVDSTSAMDTDRNDVLGDYSYALTTAVDAEIGIVGFGGSGVTRSGSGGVPPLPQSYNQIFNGATRDFKTYPPDLVVYNEGTNDSGAAVPASDVLAGLGNVIQAILTVAPGSKHLIMVPLDQAYAADIPAFVQSFGNPQVTLASTAGWFDPAESSDRTHPYNYEHVAFIAPRLIPLVVRDLR